MNDTRSSILVLDDEPAILASLTSLLRKQRLSVHAFGAAPEALEFLRTNPVNLILSDMKMPALTGREVLQKAEKMSPDSVRILMSGHESKEEILAAINSGIAQYYVFKPWDDETLRQTITEAVRLQRDLKALRLKEVLNSLGELPSPSRFQTGLLDLLAKPEKPVHELAEEIQRSPALVAKLLRMANSVFFGARQKINTVQNAIHLVGTQHVVSMAISIESIGAATGRMTPESSELVERIWEQSLQKTHLVKQIGSKWPGFHQLHELTIASLLQDIGMIIMIRYRPDEHQTYQSLLSQGAASSYALEQELFGITHEKLGEAILEYWNFPKEISRAVGRHHGSVEDDVMATILQLANILDNESEARPYDQSIPELTGNWNHITGNVIRITHHD